jgi:hypothetical protein
LNEHIRHVVVDSAGTVTNWGRQRRLFTGAAREAALFRVRRCERIGCAVPRRGCQVDHRQSWHHGGRTDLDNADGCCSHDNRAKHELGIVVKRSPNGYLNWHRRDGTYLGPVGRRRYPDDAELAARARRRLAAPIADR